MFPFDDVIMFILIIRSYSLGNRNCLDQSNFAINSQWLCNVWYGLTTNMCENSMFISVINNSWWRHQMGTFSALLAICAGNSPVTGEFPSQRPVTRSFDVFFDLRQNTRLRKQTRRPWFETLSRSSWCHCNVFSSYDNGDEGNHVFMNTLNNIFCFKHFVCWRHCGITRVLFFTLSFTYRDSWKKNLPSLFDVSTVSDILYFVK